jgi:hypothetical protein
MMVFVGMVKPFVISLGILIASHLLDEALRRTDVYWRKRKEFREKRERRSRVFHSIPIKKADSKIYRILKRLGGLIHSLSSGERDKKRTETPCEEASA